MVSSLALGKAAISAEVLGQFPSFLFVNCSSSKTSTPGRIENGPSVGQRADLMHCSSVIIVMHDDRNPSSVSTSIDA
jgi:hypothetical protein